MLNQGNLFVKDVDRIDCSVFEPSSGIVGQSWHVDIHIQGELDENGFVHDFSLVKSLVKETLKASVDHALLIPIKSKLISFEESSNEEFWTMNSTSNLTGNDSTWTYKCPKGAVFPIMANRVTPENVAIEVKKLVRHRLPELVDNVDITLRKESGDKLDTFFKYTHGISGHKGLCQRLFHGHRSKVEVFVGDEKRIDLEQYIAHDLFGTNVHIACFDQVVDDSNDDHVVLGFEGTLGYYEGKIPRKQLFMVEKQTSIETITQVLADMLAKKTGQTGIKVLCYEGIDKGAIATV